MRAVIQRVTEAAVRVNGETVAAIGAGLLVLVGAGRDDTERDVAWLADKTLNLRVFPDADGQMNLSTIDVRAEILAVSQFTLYGDCRKGRRPSYVMAAPAEEAQPLFDRYVTRLRESGLTVGAGVFRAMMQVRLVNDGPVTLLLDTRI